MQPTLLKIFGMTLAVLFETAGSVRGVVNPALQPVDLFERNAVVLSLRVAAIDEESRALTLEVIDRPKGEFAPRQVVLRVGEGEEVATAFQQMIASGQVMVAYFGAAGRGRRGAGAGGEIRLYLAQGVWATATASQQDPAQWQWTEVLDPQGPRSLFGTFNGHGQRLSDMMRDAAAGTAYFPAVPFARFEEEKRVTALSSPAAGLGLYDLDQDGDLDIIAVSKDGTAAMMQARPMEFEDRTVALGLGEAKGESIDIADANADGKADLLIGGTIYVGGAGGTFTRSSLLDLKDARPELLKSASFVDLNSDGYADILLSWTGGGISVYHHPGAAGGSYVEVTSGTGLREIEGVAQGNGFLFWGDWNKDGKPDLYYAVDGGLLLTQGGDGKFSAVPSPAYDFTTGGETAGRTGGGCFAPLWRADSTDLVVASEANVNLAINENGAAVDAAGYANEITESVAGITGVLAEDLDADGYLDLYAVNGSGMENFLYSNRGYGSFMAPKKYPQPDGAMFPGHAHASGSTAAVAGDVDGDGANDLVLAAPDGMVQLIRNATLAGRGKQAHPGAQQKVLDRTSILGVTVTAGLGSVGARVQLLNEAGVVVAQRTIAGHDLPGSRGPSTVNLAIRDPGRYTLHIRWSDGIKAELPVDLTKPASHQKLAVDRPAAK